MRAAEAVESAESGTRTPSGPAPPPAALRCDRLSKHFGGIQAVKDVSFSVAPGAMVGLIGPNGAGKTTLFNCLTGFDRPDSGTIRVDGRDVTRFSASRIASAGVVRTFQTIRMFPGLTVLESVLAAQAPRFPARPCAGTFRLPRHRREMREMRERAEDAITLLGLRGHRHAICARLPLLAQRKVELARAIAAEPRVLLLDEVSGGATPAESTELADVIRRQNERGVAIVIIEHNVPFVTSLAQHIEVLNFGEIVASGSADEIRGNEAVVEIYLGSR